jgi:GDPmannose 4,6-dehydratase
MPKVAMITGVYGQDGSILAEYLSEIGYKVIGIVHRKREHQIDNACTEIIQLDINNSHQICESLYKYQPTEFYHLAACHHSSDIKSTKKIFAEMLDINFTSTQIIIEAILNNLPRCRFMYAASSQMYSPTLSVTAVDESTRFSPSTFYGVTKCASASLIEYYREKEGLWGVTAILFNHESPKRSESYITRKISKYVAALKINGPASVGKLVIRNLDALVDWSAASDVVAAMHLSLNSVRPQDYVLASGKLHSVRNFVEIAFMAANLRYSDCVYDLNRQPDTSSKYLLGISTRAQRDLGWVPKKSFNEIVREMVEHDLNMLVR